MVKWYSPSSLKEALDLMAEQEVKPFAGGTDLMFGLRTDIDYLYLKTIPELKRIYADDEYVHIGAAATLTEAYESPVVPAIMKEAIYNSGSPAVRNAGTMGGNLGNGSDKADTVLIMFAADAKLLLASREGERIVDIDKFHIKRKTLDLRKDELIVEVLLPRHGLDNYFYEKSSGRNSMSITFVSFAGVFDMKDGRITNIAATFGAAGDAIQRFKDLESTMVGKTIEEARQMKEEYIKAYSERLLYNQSRVGPQFQKYVCRKLLEGFLEKFGI